MTKIRSITNSMISFRLWLHPRTVGSFWGYARAKANQEHIGFKLFFQAARLCLGKGQSQTSCQSTSIQCGVPPRWRDYRKQQKRHIGSSLGTTRGISRGEVWQKYQKRLCQDWQESRQQIVCAGTFRLVGVVSCLRFCYLDRVGFVFGLLHLSSKTVTNPRIHTTLVACNRLLFVGSFKAAVASLPSRRTKTTFQRILIFSILNWQTKKWRHWTLLHNSIRKPTQKFRTEILWNWKI